MMDTMNDISGELKSMESFLAGMSLQMPYGVPAGYFENFSAGLRQTINGLEEKDTVADWGKSMPYPVPVGYFETLPASVIDAALNAEVTLDLPRTVPLDIPTAYFESLPAKILLAAKQSGPAKKQSRQVPLRKYNTFRPVRWAAAAVILICISVGSYITFFNPAQSPNPEGILASVSNNEIHDYLQGTYRIDIDRIVANNDLNNIPLDNKDIIQYLNETGWDNVE